MSDFTKALRPGEPLRREGGVSAKSLTVDGVSLVLIVAAYWLGMRYLLTLGSASPLSAAIAPAAQVFFNVLTAFLAMVAAYVIVVLLLRAAFTRYGLTDSRVVRRSFLRVRGAELAHVQDVEVTQTLLGKLFGYGDVLVRTAGGTLVLRRIDRPSEWFREIHEALKEPAASS